MSELERVTYEFHEKLIEQLSMDEVDNNEENEYIMGMAEIQAEIANARSRGE